MPIPKHAKRVFKGIIFEIYQWPQKMFDGSVAIFERARRINTVVIIATAGNKIVLLKQQQPGNGWYYDLPSGRMDKAGESPKAAALRELREETSLKPEKLKLWKVYSPGGKVSQKVYFFVAQNCKKVSEQKLDPGEKIQVFYKNFEDFLKLSDHRRTFFGPLIIDVLLARVHPQNRSYLKKVFFGDLKRLPKPPQYGPQTNW